MSSTAPTPSPSSQAMIDAAKASILAYNDKNWDNVRASLTPDALYDEVCTQRKIQGLDQVVECWQGWARALPDSKATIHGTCASGNTVCIEMTWRGKHTGPLELPTGPLAATQQRVDGRSTTASASVKTSRCRTGSSTSSTAATSSSTSPTWTR